MEKFIQVLYKHPTHPFPEEFDPIDEVMDYTANAVPIKYKSSNRGKNKTIGYVTTLWRDSDSLCSICFLEEEMPDGVQYVPVFSLKNSVVKLSEIICR